MPEFTDFAADCEVVKSLQRHGKKIAPLQLIGTFLSYAGNAMLFDIWKKCKKKIFYGNHVAVKIQQVQADSRKNIFDQTTFWLTEARYDG